jgi:hypothetical protein
MEIKSEVLTPLLQKELKSSDLLSFCLNQIKRFPEDEIDEEVMISCVDLISKACQDCYDNAFFVLRKDGMRKLSI